MIEAQADIRTSDGYLLRVFCIGFTMKIRGQIRKTCYAQHTQVSLIHIEIEMKIIYFFDCSLD